MYITDANDWDYTRWPNFGPHEWACKHCGVLYMYTPFLDEMQKLRDAYGNPIHMNSGHRCKVHNNNVSSTGDHGPHPQGKAGDISCHHKQAIELLRLSTQMQFTGFGLQQKGNYDARFLHLDMVHRDFGPAIWTY